MCIERRHVSRSAFCCVAVRCAYARDATGSPCALTRAHAVDKCIHVRATTREEFSRSLLLVLSSRSSARFLPSRSRELVVIPVFRALPHFFVDQSNRPGWRNVYLSENESVRDSRMEEKSRTILLTIDWQDERSENLISRTRWETSIYQRDTRERKNKIRMFAADIKKYNIR